MDDFDDLEFDDDDSLAIIKMQDESGEDKDFIIIDSKVYKNNNYLLVIEADAADEDESDAYILKELKEVDGDSYYTVLEDGHEFNEVSILFDNDDYEIEL